MKRLMLLFPLSLLMFSCAGWPQAPERVDAALVDWAGGAILPVDPSGEFPFDPSVWRDHDLILGGEAHATAANFPLKFQIFKTLYDQAGIRVMVVEIGPSQAMRVMDYLRTGDEALLPPMFEALRGSSASNQCYRDYLEDLRTWYRNLPADDRFVILGADIEHQTEFARGQLLSLAGKVDLPRDLRALVQSAAGGGLDELGPLLGSLDEGRWASILDPATLFELRQVAVNLDSAYRAYDSDWEGFSAIREDQIYENMTAIAEQYPEQKIYGHFGGFHTALRVDGNADALRLGVMLESRSDSPFRDRVFSIALSYGDRSVGYHPKGRYPINGLPREFLILMEDRNWLTAYLPLSGAPESVSRIPDPMGGPSFPRGAYDAYLLVRQSSSCERWDGT